MLIMAGMINFSRTQTATFMSKRGKKHSCNERKVSEKILNSDIYSDNWASSLAGIPIVIHSVVENYFELTSDEKHLTEGYTFSKTKKFETSGKPM